MAAPAKPSRSTILLHIIRTLIHVGRQRLAAVRSQPGPEETQDIACAFGTFNVALIIARILRGLRITAALENRVIAAAPSLDAPLPARTTSPTRTRPMPKRPNPRTTTPLAHLPTDREIAEMVRRRPIGAVLIEICHDLGIGTDHPLWHELQSVIIEHDGQIVPTMKQTIQRIYDAHQEIAKGLVPDFQINPRQTHDTTGPPPRSQQAA